MTKTETKTENEVKTIAIDAADLARASARGRSPMSGRSAPTRCARLFPQAPRSSPGSELFALLVGERHADPADRFARCRARERLGARPAAR